MRAIQQNNTFGANLPPLRDRLKYYQDVRPYTMVVDLPDYTFFKDMLRQADPLSDMFKAEIDITVGLSVVNPLDQFSRKEGLKTALTKMKPVKAKLQELHIDSSGDIELLLDVGVDMPIRVLLGYGRNRAIITRDYQYHILYLYEHLYGRNDVLRNSKED